MTGTIRRELRNVITVTATVAGGAIGSLGSNWSLALVALGLSATLWAVVSSELNPPKVDVFPTALTVEPVNLPSGLGLFRPLDTVRVKISAPLDSWNRLTPSSLRAVADLSRSAQGMQEVAVKVESADRQVKVIDVIPSRLPARLDIVTEKTVLVRVNLLDSVPFGYSFKTPSVTPARVKVAGPEALVNQVEVAETDIRLEGTTVSISQPAKLVARDAQGTRVEGVRLDPQTALVEVPIQQELSYVTLPINPAIAGNVASGYWVASVSVTPSTITIVGKRESLQSVNFVSTEVVEVGGASSDVVKAVGLSVPAGVSLVGTPRVTVRVTVAASEGRRSYSLDPSVAGLPPEKHASVGSVEVVVSGPLPLLQITQVSQITATIDLNGAVTGTQKLRPRVILPDGLKLVTITPEQVEVQVK